MQNEPTTINATYPIGKHIPAAEFDLTVARQHADTIKQFPAELQLVTSKLKPAHFQATYRPGSWTVLQIIHHLADSHANAYIRLKLALTEDSPAILPYNQDKWAQLADVTMPNVGASIAILEGVHERMGTLLASLTEEEWEKCYYHPEKKTYVPLWDFASGYAWHGAHHLGQIQAAVKAMG